LNSTFSHFGAKSPGGFGGAAVVVVERWLTVLVLLAVRCVLPPVDLVYETPVPGTRAVVVTLPCEFTVTLPALPPTDVLTPRGVTVILTPGMTLNGFRMRNPMS
jgi:hypothetical protein